MPSDGAARGDGQVQRGADQGGSADRRRPVWQASAQGARVRFSGSKRTVIDGPFAETKELVAGYWIWEVKSLQEAIDWVKRCPNPHTGESEIEIRRIFETEEFANAPPEVVEQEKKFRSSRKSKKT